MVFSFRSHRSVDMGPIKEGSSYCPQSEPVKRKVYAGSASYGRIQKTLGEQIILRNSDGDTATDDTGIYVYLDIIVTVIFISPWSIYRWFEKIIEGKGGQASTRTANCEYKRSRFANLSTSTLPIAKANADADDRGSEAKSRGSVRDFEADVLRTGNDRSIALNPARNRKQSIPFSWN